MKKFKQISDVCNRGKLCDVSFFIFNVLLITIFSKPIIQFISIISEYQIITQIIVGCLSFGMLILPAIGANLKHYRFRQRNPKTTEKIKSKKKIEDDDDEFADGVRLLGLIMFATLIFLYGLGAYFLFSDVLSGSKDVSKTFVLIEFIGLIILSFIYSIIIPGYFGAIEDEQQRSEFIKSKKSELIGDICIWLNMLIFQTFWVLYLNRGFSPESRTAFFIISTLLLYLPPRLVFLLEDFSDYKTWLTMMLANVPIIIRIVFGS